MRGITNTSRETHSLFGIIVNLDLAETIVGPTVAHNSAVRLGLRSDQGFSDDSFAVKFCSENEVTAPETELSISICAKYKRQPLSMPPTLEVSAKAQEPNIVLSAVEQRATASKEEVRIERLNEGTPSSSFVRVNDLSCWFSFERTLEAETSSAMHE
jgi:hypothetical protein